MENQRVHQENGAAQYSLICYPSLTSGPQVILVGNIRPYSFPEGLCTFTKIIISSVTLLSPYYFPSQFHFPENIILLPFLEDITIQKIFSNKEKLPSYLKYDHATELCLEL